MFFFVSFYTFIIPPLYCFHVLRLSDCCFFFNISLISFCICSSYFLLKFFFVSPNVWALVSPFLFSISEPFHPFLFISFNFFLYVYVFCMCSPHLFFLYIYLLFISPAFLLFFSFLFDMIRLPTRIIASRSSFKKKLFIYLFLFVLFLFFPFWCGEEKRKKKRREKKRKGKKIIKN